MLKTPLKILLAASVAVPAFLAADLAQAGQKKHKRHHSGHQSGKYYSSHNYSKHYGSHHYKRNYSHYYYPSYTYGGYYYGGHHGRGGKAGAYAGLAILGATLGYVLHKSSRDNYNRGKSGGYYAPPPRPQNYAPTQQSNFDFSQCRETRDYETTIIVDGQQQLAYGTACLMADGNWVAGPMRIGN